MPIPCSVKDRELQKFVECRDEVAVRTAICQDENSSIDVSVVPRGITKNIYNDVSAVVITVETLINTYTVAIGKKFDLKNLSCSGDNIARFIIKINGLTVIAKRTWWTDFNADFSFTGETLSAGDKVEIFVENNGIDSSDFESTITGGEYDE